MPAGPNQDLINKLKGQLEADLAAIAQKNYEVEWNNDDWDTQLQHKKGQIQVDQMKLSNAIQQLQKQITKWDQFIKECSFDRTLQEKEKKSKAGVVNGDKGILELIAHTKEVIEALEENIGELTRKESAWRIVVGQTRRNQQEQEPPGPLTSTDSLGTGYPPMVSHYETRQQWRPTVHLPRLDMCTFNGDIKQWIPFWETFKATVDDQPIPTIHKMAYLQNVLKGDAKDAIAGFSPTEANYLVVINLLKRRFGDKERIRYHLHQELQTLPTARERTSDVRKVFEQIESVCRQLEAMGESSDHPQVDVAHSYAH